MNVSEPVHLPDDGHKNRLKRVVVNRKYIKYSCWLCQSEYINKFVSHIFLDDKCRRQWNNRKLVPVN